MPEPHRSLSDPRELNALAHPVRMAIVEILSIDGPLTASELAERLDETPANCSWHLRKLAQHGFVVEAEGGKGRQRPWQVPGLGFRWDEEHAAASLEERRAAQALSEVVMSRAIDRLRESQQRAPEESEQWRAARSNVEMVAWLTPDELKEMNDAINTVLDRHVQRLTDPAQRPAGARLCEFVSWGVPVYFPGVEPA
ncbi:helix-turn-helix domain-containing protein [Kribbella solani]|uniref:winged helix-turn-helix domain-containing protein n=1 Tax=Kribbella solani TaxID=236067 RepID=UPI0029AE9AA7|nr:helix-turn-helix domain-containing protein [Kribbella solani]MDX2971333.1 helix-turn-helix domain-containing protein [Kribbella solani]MDX3000574.1 helix-turn-helix domain-containing protein [Kribbella solani]